MEDFAAPCTFIYGGSKGYDAPQEAKRRKRAEQGESYKYGMPEIVHRAFKEAKVDRYLEEAARVLKLKYQVCH